MGRSCSVCFAGRRGANSTCALERGSDAPGDNDRFPERLLLHDVCIGSGYSAYATIEESSRQPPAARGPDYRVMRAGLGNFLGRQSVSNHR